MLDAKRWPMIGDQAMGHRHRPSAHHRPPVPESPRLFRVCDLSAIIIDWAIASPIGVDRHAIIASASRWISLSL